MRIDAVALCCRRWRPCRLVCCRRHCGAPQLLATRGQRQTRYMCLTLPRVGPHVLVDAVSRVLVCACTRLSRHQSEKLMFGATKTCISCFEDVTLMHVAHYPLVITFVASSTANLGMMSHIVPQLKRALGPVQVKAEAELG